MDVLYPDVDLVIALHAQMLRDTGYPPTALRDRGLLESALNKPQMAAHYEDADLVRQATLLGVGIAQNQPFIDGNKRAAYLAMLTFLRVNDRAYEGEPMQLAHQIESLGTRADSLDAATDRFGAWLREHVAPL